MIKLLNLLKELGLSKQKTTCNRALITLPKQPINVGSTAKAIFQNRFKNIQARHLLSCSMLHETTKTQHKLT